MKVYNVRWCEEEEIYINMLNHDCNYETECYADCYTAKAIYKDDDYQCGMLRALVYFDRSLPEEDTPTTYIEINKDELDKLPKLVSLAINHDPHNDIYLKII